MKIYSHPARRFTLRQTRHGVLTTWTILIMLTAGAICGGLLNLMWKSAVRNQAQNCAASAALAAGHSYLSDDMLRSWQQPFEYEGRMARCQQSAVNMVDEYRRGTCLPAITSDAVEVNWTDRTGPAKDPALLVPHSISVQFSGTCLNSGFDSVFKGIGSAVSSYSPVKCSVCLEHSPRAFKAGPGQTIPMLPFAVCDEVPAVDSSSSPVPTGYWTSNIESGKGQDRFSWNPETHQFETGPDGLPEITLTLYSSASLGQPDALIPLDFSGRPDNRASNRTCDWIRAGIRGEDISAMGWSEIAFPGSVPFKLITAQELLSCQTALREKTGEACLLALSSAIPAADSVTAISLKRPVAARIVQVTNSVSGSLKVVMQPCVLATSTAVTSKTPDTAFNRYVYSVRLSN